MKKCWWLIPIIVIFSGVFYAVHAGYFGEKPTRPEDDFFLINFHRSNGSANCQIVDGRGAAVRVLPGEYCEADGQGGFFYVGNGGLETAFVARIKDEENQWQSEARVHHNLNREPGTQNIFFPVERLIRAEGVRAMINGVRGLDGNGKTIFQWDEEEHLQQIAALSGRPLHLETKRWATPAFEGRYYNFNGVAAIPENSVASQLPAFKKGNLILSYPSNLILVLDRQTGDIIYHLRIDQLFDARHKADELHTVGVNGRGEILAYINFYLHDNGTFTSLLVRIDPRTGKVLWRYPEENGAFFYNGMMGAIYETAPGHYLVTNTAGCEFFTLDESGHRSPSIRPEYCSTGPGINIFYVKKLSKGDVLGAP